MADFKINNFLRYIGSLVVLALVWTSALSAQTETVTLQGYVHAQGAKPLAGVLIRVTSTIGKSNQQTRPIVLVPTNSPDFNLATTASKPVLPGSPHCNGPSLWKANLSR